MDCLHSFSGWQIQGAATPWIINFVTATKNSKFSKVQQNVMSECHVFFHLYFYIAAKLPLGPIWNDTNSIQLFGFLSFRTRPDCFIFRVCAQNRERPNLQTNNLCSFLIILCKHKLLCIWCPWELKLKRKNYTHFYLWFLDDAKYKKHAKQSKNGNTNC